MPVIMSNYCERHERRYAGPACPWCVAGVLTAGELAASRLANEAQQVANAAQELANATSTYRHRDVEQRRGYMRDYMRARRARERRK